jgi:crotonobetainyl-CoA:carnitine CoA-transferase CaiB-like acyl-CoA transferase
MLSGKRILDLSWVLGGPFAGQLLAQLGAEVIKVEALGGDLARRVPPVSSTQDSPFFLSVNRASAASRWT